MAQHLVADEGQQLDDLFQRRLDVLVAQLLGATLRIETYSRYVALVQTHIQHR